MDRLGWVILCLLAMGMVVLGQVASGQPQSSSGITPLSPTPQILKCYGNSEYVTWDSGTLYQTSWWTCGSPGDSLAYECTSGGSVAAGYKSVAVGFYTWYYTDMWGNNVSRCRLECATLTAYQPITNCVWGPSP